MCRPFKGQTRFARELFGCKNEKESGLAPAETERGRAKNFAAKMFVLGWNNRIKARPQPLFG